MELIPGLPDDVGMECLIRVPYKHFSSVASVCRSWKIEIQLPEFWRHRKAASFTRRIILMAQARVNTTRHPGGIKDSANSAHRLYRLTLCEPETGIWVELPPVPRCSAGLPMFCQLAAVGLNLVIMGGWHPVTWENSNAVFVYNFVSGTWRRGRDMPGLPRLLFACASDSGRMVFVAGGHDNDKNALRSAMAYDVELDKWVPLPDMAQERDECKGVFHRGKFHVIGGYHTEMQGRFGTSAEAFDAATWKWDHVQTNYLNTAMCPRSCVDGGDRVLYMCQAGNVVALLDSTWQVVAKLPADLYTTAYMTAWQDKVVVIGSSGFGRPHNAYVLDLRSYTWTKVEPPEEFSGHVQTGCCLEI